MTAPTKTAPAAVPTPVGPALTRAVHDRIRRDRQWILEPLLIDTVIGALTALGFDPDASTRTQAAEDAAITLAARVGTLHEHVAREQARLWTDLYRALEGAANGVWSVTAEHVATRVVEAARLVGPTPVEDVPWPLAGGGVWEALLAAAGVPVVPPNAGTWDALEAAMVARLGGGTRVELAARWARTVEAVGRAAGDGAFTPDDGAAGGEGDRG